jgi:hypothetical protein
MESYVVFVTSFFCSMFSSLIHVVITISFLAGHSGTSWESATQELEASLDNIAGLHLKKKKKSKTTVILCVVKQFPLYGNYWSVRLFLFFGCYKQCYDYLCASFWVDLCIQFSWVST